MWIEARNDLLRYPLHTIAFSALPPLNSIKLPTPPSLPKSVTEYTKPIFSLPNNPHQMNISSSPIISTTPHPSSHHQHLPQRRRRNPQRNLFPHLSMQKKKKHFPFILHLGLLPHSRIPSRKDHQPAQILLAFHHSQKRNCDRVIPCRILPNQTFRNSDTNGSGITYLGWHSFGPTHNRCKEFEIWYIT